MPKTRPASTRILRAATVWGAVATLAIAVIGAGIGYLVGGPHAAYSALAGAAIAAILMLLTSASILFANRWFGQDLFVPLFFGIVMGAWILKLIVFIAAMLLLRGQPWIDPVVFFVAVVLSVLASLAIDAVTMMRIRLPYADVKLPGDDDDENEPAKFDAE